MLGFAGPPSRAENSRACAVTGVQNGYETDLRRIGVARRPQRATSRKQRPACAMRQHVPRVRSFVLTVQAIDGLQPLSGDVE